LARRKTATRHDLERVRSELSRELKGMGTAQRKDYLKAAGEVFAGLAKMAKIRTDKG
jgi:hypothetical protein